MPEGDTVHKLARALRPELEGRGLSGVWLRDRGWVAPLAGRTVRELAPLGKHLLVVLGEDAGATPRSRLRDWVLHVHLGMHGRWRRSAVGTARPPGEAVVALQTDAARFVCTRAARAELLRRGALPFHPQLSRLGPDLLADPVPFGRIVARARRREPRTVSDLLLDQTVASGIGNVYKSEVLFLEGVHPRAGVGDLSDRLLESLYRRAAALMRDNLGGWRRTTVRRVTSGDTPRPGEVRLFVYGRAGQPCLHCHGGIREARVGDGARATWWCPRCQSPKPPPKEG